MTRKKLNLATFEGRNDRVLWQPRLSSWFFHHRERGTLPDRFKDLDQFDFYDTMRCSMRYPRGPYISEILRRNLVQDGLEQHDEHDGNHVVEHIRTPTGELRTVFRLIRENDLIANRRIETFAVKTPQDLRTLTDLVERERFEADLGAYEDLVSVMGDRAEITLGIASAGFTELIKRWAGLLNAVYLLNDSPSEMEVYLEACERRDDRIMEQALKLPCRLWNLPDHPTNEFTPPPILKKYMIPRWQRLCERFHAAGCFVHCHWDGNSRLMLPFLQETGLDGVEALTPAPMGDMTFEEIKAAVGDRLIVLDLLPTIDFLPNAPLDRLLDRVRQAIDMFAPRLILGISDELSPVGQIEKVEAVTDLVDRICGLAG